MPGPQTGRIRKYDDAFVAERSHVRDAGPTGRFRRGRMESSGHEPAVGTKRTVVRVLVLASAIAIAILLTRCPLTGSPDGPVPAPRPRGL